MLNPFEWISATLLEPPIFILHVLMHRVSKIPRPRKLTFNKDNPLSDMLNWNRRNSASTDTTNKKLDSFW